MQENRYTFTITATVSELKRIHEKSGEDYLTALAIALCQGAELGLTIQGLDHLAELFEELVESAQAPSPSCNPLMKLEETSCKEDQEDQQSLPL